MTKEAGLFGANGQRAKELEAQLANVSSAIKKLNSDYDYQNAKLRSVMDQGNSSSIVQKSLQKVDETEGSMADKLEQLKAIHASHGDVKQEIAKRNLAIAGGVGLPGLAALSYGFEAGKDNNN